MSEGNDDIRYPSVEEFMGWYNLGFERDDGYPVPHSTDYMPEFEHAEFIELYIAENQWFDQLVPDSSRKHHDPLADPPFFLRSDADDRTVDVDTDFEFLTIDVLTRIQVEFLGRHPLWRVVLIAEQPSCSIVFYPTAIRFGNLPMNVKPENALRELVLRG